MGKNLYYNLGKTFINNITKISDLTSRKGKEGRLYYNITDKNYYIWKDNQFSLLSEEEIEATDSLINVLEPEEGKIYYSKDTSKYFIWDKNSEAFRELGSSIETVEELGDIVNQESGKLYYNLEDNKYYIWDSVDQEFKEFGAGSIEVITDIDDVPQHDPQHSVDPNTYVLSPNKFYDITDWNRGDDPMGTYLSMDFYLEEGEGIYAGRFTSWEDNLMIIWPNDVTIPDTVDTTILANHRYEFSIYRNVLFLVDITEE